MYLPRNIIQLFSLHPRCAPQSPPHSFEFFIDLAFSPLAVSHHCIVPIRSLKPILGPILSPWPANESACPFGPILTICIHKNSLCPPQVALEWDDHLHPSNRAGGLKFARIHRRTGRALNWIRLASRLWMPIHTMTKLQKILLQ